MTINMLDLRPEAQEMKVAYTAEQMIAGFDGVLCKPTQRGLLQFFKSSHDNQQLAYDKLHAVPDYFKKYIIGNYPEERYSGGGEHSHFPNLNSRESDYDPYLGNIRALEFHDGLSLLSTPQIEKMLTQLHEVWLGLKTGRIGDREEDNIKCALNYVGDVSRGLAKEWKKRVPEGSSAGLAILRKFCSDVPEDAILRDACSTLAIYLVPQEQKYKAQEYFLEKEPEVIWDEWLQKLTGDYIWDRREVPYIRDPYRVGLLFRHNTYESTQDFPSSRGEDADGAFCRTLWGFERKDLPILRQWINDLRVIEDMLQTDLAELGKRGIDVSPDNKRKEEKYLPAVPRLALFCQTAYKMLTDDHSWKEDVHRLISESTHEGTNNYVLQNIASLTVALVPEEGRAVAAKIFQEMFTYTPEDRLDFFHKLGVYDYKVLIDAVWKAIYHDPVFVHQLPMVLQLPGEFLNDIVSTEDGELYDDSFSMQLMDSTLRRWLADGKIDPQENQNLARFFAQKIFKQYAAHALSSHEEWMAAGVDRPVNLGVSPINLQILDQILEIRRRCEGTESSYCLSKLRLVPDCWQAFDMLSDMRTEDLIKLIDQLYTKYWIDEAESMMCVNAKTGMCFWVNAKNGESVRTNLELTDDGRYNENKNIEGTLFSYPFFKKLSAEKIKSIVQGGLPEQGDDEYYVLPMNPIIREVVKRAYAEILKADPAVFEKEITKMFQRDDSVPLAIKYDLLGSCGIDEYSGSLRELAYLHGQLRTALTGLCLAEEEIRSYTDPLLPIGFGMTNTGSLLARQTPEQYYLKLRERINAVLLPMVRTRVISEVGSETRIVQELTLSDDNELVPVPVRQKLFHHPIAYQLADDVRFDQLTPTAQITMLARAPGGNSSSVDRERKPLASILLPKSSLSAVTFPFSGEVPHGSAMETLSIHGLRALQINHLVLLLKEGLLPDHIRRMIYPKTDSFTDCLMPDHQSVARPVQHDLYVKFTDELQQGLIRALRHKNQQLDQEDGKKGVSNDDEPPIYFFPDSRLSEYGQEFGLPQTVLDASTLENEMQSFSEILPAKIRTVSIAKLASYAVDNLENGLTTKEISRLFNQLHPRMNYWLFSGNPTVAGEPDANGADQQLTFSDDRISLLNITENNLDVLYKVYNPERWGKCEI